MPPSAADTPAAVQELLLLLLLLLLVLSQQLTCSLKALTHPQCTVLAQTAAGASFPRAAGCCSHLQKGKAITVSARTPHNSQQESS